MKRLQGKREFASSSRPWVLPQNQGALEWRHQKMNLHRPPKNSPAKLRLHLMSKPSSRRPAS